MSGLYLEREDKLGREVTRRTIVRNAAWALPVIAASVATPAAAASEVGEACPAKGEMHVYRPENYGSNDSMGPLYNVAEIQVVVGVGLTITFVKVYQWATAVNINGRIVQKWDNGAPVGTTFTYPLDDICDPWFVQVDGNNTHYYGNGRFA